MRFTKLADYFERLEATTKRLEMFDILSQLFNEAGEEEKGEVDKVVYLCQEQLLPSFKGVEIGMAEKLILRAIAKAIEETETDVAQLYKKLGDPGLVVEQLLTEQKGESARSRLGVSAVYEELLKIAETSGEGSVEKKIQLLAELLSQCSPKEARYVARFVMGRLRLGIGDPTILDALSKAFVGDRSFRPGLERAYNLCSDLGLVARTLFDKGEKGIQEFAVNVGNPIRMALAERSPTAEEIIERLGRCAIEVKLDGFRCVSGFTPIYVKDKGIISVRDVKIGDLVLTHKGQFKEVVAKSKRTIESKERVFRFQSYLGNEFKITEGHHVLCKKNGRIRWIPVEDISNGDELVFPIPQQLSDAKPPGNEMVLETRSGYKKTFKLNKNFYRFLGFWVGDGYTNDYHHTERVGLVFNAKKERELCNFYKRIITQEFGITNISESISNGALCLYWRDEPLKEWLSRHFRRDWKGKMIPPWFCNVSQENFFEFLRGWMESDGTTDDRGRSSITTKEKDLATLVQLIALRFRKIIGVRRIRVNGGAYFKLILPKRDNHTRIEGNKVLVKVLKKEVLSRPDPRLTVYNLQVQDHESYCTTMVSLHNCQIHKDRDKVEVFSRNLERTTPMFPDIVEGVREQIDAKEAIFEGEALAVNEETGELYPFQVTVQRKRKHGIKEMMKEYPLVLYCFDLMYADGVDYTKEPYAKRRERLEQLIKPGERIKLAEQIVTDDPKMIEQFFETNIERGLEGIVAKRLDAPYQAGARGFHWIKLKRSYKGELSDTVDVVIVGYFRGRGMRAKFGIGALLGAVYDDKSDTFKTVAKIGSGLTEENWVRIRELLDEAEVLHRPARVDSLIEPDVWVEPKYVFAVLADEITKSPIHTCGKRDDEPGYALRFPRVVSWIREDKNPQDANTVKEIIEMFEMQKKVKASP